MSDVSETTDESARAIPGATSGECEAAVRSQGDLALGLLQEGLCPACVLRFMGCYHARDYMDAAAVRAIAWHSDIPFGSTAGRIK